VIIHAMWKYKIDPDTSSIPYLTALGDLFGSTLLLGAFAFLRLIHREYEGRSVEALADMKPTTFDFLLTTFGTN
jgi:solute carrier family 41